MFGNTTHAIADHCDPQANEAIRQRTAMNVRCYALAGSDAIEARLKELDEEWDIERALQANAATASLLGVVMGVTRSRLWWVLPTAVSAFLLQHATRGWCPPMAWLRRLGYRTQAEIELERDALRAVRGDYEGLPIYEDEQRLDVEETLNLLRERRNGEQSTS